MSNPSAPRKTSVLGWVIIIVIVVAVVAVASMHWLGTKSAHRPVSNVSAPVQMLSAEQRGHIRASFSALPLAFEANQGQTDAQVNYIARGKGYTVFLTPTDTVFALHSSSGSAKSSPLNRFGRTPQPAAASTKKDLSAAIHMQLVGGNPQAQIAGTEKLPGKSNYFIGNDASKWQTNVPQYARVSYQDVYPGVNLAFYGAERQLEFDFLVCPNASTTPIRFGVSGAKQITTDKAGNLLLSSTAGNVTLHKPQAYQEKDGVRRPVDARFVLQANHQIGFILGPYDRSRELVIDPSVSYATYLGGLGEDDGNAIAIDGSGNAYVTGQTASSNFPTTGSAYSTSNAGGFDVFVTEISADGSTLLYSTYIGGTSSDSGNAIVVDSSGDAFVAGGTASSTTFPHTSGAFQTTFGGGSLDAFVLELAAGGGSLTFSTFLGGTGADVAYGIAIDSSGVYVVGSTTSTDFPLKNAKQGAIVGTSNGFVTKLDSTGATEVYSTYLGGGTGDLATAVAVDGSNQAYVTGATQNPGFPTTSGAFQTTCGTGSSCNGGLDDAFVTVYNSAGSSYIYSTFLGGEEADQGYGIAVDASGDAYVTGATASSHFPVQSAFQSSFGGGPEDAFVAALNSTGSGLLYSSYLGGSLNDTGTGIAIDGNKNVYVTGQTGSSNFPTKNPTQSTLGGNNDAFVTEVSSAGSLLFSSYLGGAQNENSTTSGGNVGALGAIAVDSAGANIYVAGNTASTNFPTQSPKQASNGGGIDAFVAKYATSGSSGSFTVANGALSVTSGAPGVSATSTITVTSTGGFNSAVSLACTVSPSVTDGPTCAFSNPGSSVTPPANGTVTAMLTINTTAASARLNRPANGNSPGLLYATLLPIVGIAFLGAGFGSARSPRKKLFGFLQLGLLLTGLLLLPACSGGGGGGGGGNGGTPANAYTINVTGTSGATVVTGAPALTLNVT